MSDLSAPLPPACDVVVLGGGASGSSIAYQLAKRGVDVLLLEAGDIGQGASGRNGGLLDTAVDPASPLVDYYYRSAELWPVLAEELLDTSGVDIEYLRAGTLQIVLEGDADKDEIDAEFRGHLEQGYDVRWLDRDETLALSRLFPENTLGGWLRPMDGQVNPLLLCYALALGAARHGGRVRQNTPATALLVETPGGLAAAEPRRYPGVTGARTAGCDAAPAGPGRRRAHARGRRALRAARRRPRAVDAAVPGPAGARRSRPAPARPDLRHRAAAAAHGGRLPLRREPVHLLAPDPARGLTIGGARPQDHHGDFLLESVGAATTLDVQRIVLDMAARVHPSLADVAVIRWWGGVMGFTEDLLPVLGRLDEHTNVVTACGFCPNGILCAPMTGEVIADVVTGETPAVPLEPYSLSRFAG